MNIDIDTIKRRLLIKYPFFGSVVANLEYVESRDIYSNGHPTAATDGNTIYYHPDFINSLTKEEQIFIFAHEVSHVAFNHIFRGEGKDNNLWNIATDAVINASLAKDGLKLVKGSIDMPEAINYDAEELYQKLLEEKKNNQNNNQSKNDSGENKNNQNSSLENNSHSNQNNNSSLDNNQSSSSDNSSSNDSSDSPSNSSEEKEQNQDVGHDSHSMWQDAIKKKKEQEQTEEKSENSSTNLSDKEKTKNKLQEQIEKISSMGEKKIFEQNKIERKKQLEELRKSFVKDSLQAGNTTSSENRKIFDIGVSEPLIDWRRLLKEAVTYDIDWSYKNSSIEDGVVTPYLEDIPTPEAEIVLDTSGSIDEVLLKNFLRECKNILQSSKVKVGCFDTKFYGFQEIRNVNDIDNMRFLGGGGTDFDVAVDAFSKRVENKIIFTDGCASMPNKTIDAIWVVFGNAKINPKGGKVIYIDEYQLRNLSSYISNKHVR